MEKNEYSCILNLPYPCIKGRDNNRLIAELLYRAYFSELSAVSEYLYQEILFEKEYKVASEIIECISITEMKHFNMIGKLIFELGYDPKIKFTDGTHKSIKVARNPSVNDAFFKNAIYGDIIEERSSVMGYRRIVEMTTDSNIKSLINRIILDEENHIETLERLIK